MGIAVVEDFEEVVGWLSEPETSRRRTSSPICCSAAPKYPGLKGLRRMV